jgi:serine/threonine protein kinase
MLIIGRTFNVGDTEYKIVSEVNNGAFGTIYRAEAPNAPYKPALAVKVPASHVLKSDEWRRRFQREARILGNIQHVNVVRTLGLLSYDDGALMLVQEFVDNAQELGAYKYTSDSELLSFILQVLYGLRVTHGTSQDTRAIHRDLSPRNILISPAGLAKIIDFGLAKEDPRTSTILTVAGYTLGTPGCIAPEQHLDSASVDHRADLYALGRSFAAALQRRRPEHVDVNALHEPWRSALQKLTNYVPEQRFADAEETIQWLLQEFLESNIIPEHLDVHFNEYHGWDKVPDGWSRVASMFFSNHPTAIGVDALRLAYKVTPSMLSSVFFDADAAFSRLMEPLDNYFLKGLAAFAECDPLGVMLSRWYEFLTPDNKLHLFSKLCKLAVSYHRYSVMEDVRITYRKEKDPALAAQLLAILNGEDPTTIIRRP